MQFSAVLLLAFTALTTALPQPAALSLTLSPRQVGTVVTNVTCTPGATSCEDCPPHEDGFPPNCVGLCNADGVSFTVTETCPTVCATECPFEGCPIVCD